MVLEWVHRVLSEDGLRQMGHGQRADDGNLGLGWLYYALGRWQRCGTAVVIGSYRGFVPLMVAKALGDNAERGDVIFIDPSLWDDFWSDPRRTIEHFERFDIKNVRHFRMTTQEFVDTDVYRRLDGVGLIFIDGEHSYEQARFDYEAFESKLSPDGLVLLHDSMTTIPETYSTLDRTYMTGVTFFVDELQRRPDLQVFDFPPPEDGAVFSTGLTLIRRKTAKWFKRFRDVSRPGYGALRSAIENFNAGRFGDASREFAVVVEADPAEPVGWLLKGMALMSEGECKSARACFESARRCATPRMTTLVETYLSCLEPAAE